MFRKDANLQKIENLENFGMIENMHSDFVSFIKTSFLGCSSSYQWKRWIRF